MKTKKVKRGEFGYIQDRKKRVILHMLVLLLAALVIFVIGLLLNKMSRTNVFTVIAILFVLPWAKQLVALIVIFPYKSVSKERYDKVKKCVPEGMTLYTDMIITSPDKIMDLDFLVAGHGQVIGLVASDKQDISYIRKYLRGGVGNWSDDYRVKIVESEKLFFEEMSRFEEREIDIEEEERVQSYLRSLIV